MERLNTNQTQALADVFGQAMDLNPEEKTSYHLAIKEVTTGFELPYGSLTQHELKQLSKVLEPHSFFSGNEWYTSTQETSLTVQNNPSEQPDNQTLLARLCAYCEASEYHLLTLNFEKKEAWVKDLGSGDFVTCVYEDGEWI